MTYKTADQLGITQAEHDGLIKLADYFERKAGVIEFVPNADEKDEIEREDVAGRPIGFNMGVAAIALDPLPEYQCGCVACIGGHLSLLMQGVPLLDQATLVLTYKQIGIAHDYVMERRGSEDPLYPLFFPENLFEKVKPKHVGPVIRNFLTTGKTNYRTVIRKLGA